MNERSETNPKPKYRVHWTHKTTGRKSYGEPMPESVAVAVTNDMQKRFKDLDCWIEPAE